MRCVDCGWFTPSMDGPECGKMSGTPHDFVSETGKRISISFWGVYPEGRDGVPDWCPLGYESIEEDKSTVEGRYYHGVHKWDGTEVFGEEREDYLRKAGIPESEWGRLIGDDSANPDMGVKNDHRRTT